MATRLATIRAEHDSGVLRALSAKCSGGAQVRRMLALALVMEGYSRSEAASLNGVDRQTLRNWMHRYNAAGIEGLKSRKSPWHPCHILETGNDGFRFKASPSTRPRRRGTYQPARVMCGTARDSRATLQEFGGGTNAVMCPAFWRGAMAASPDGFREWHPNNSTALICR